MLENNFKNEFITFLKENNLYIKYRYKLFYNSYWEFCSIVSFFDYVSPVCYLSSEIFTWDNELERIEWQTYNTIWWLYLYAYHDIPLNVKEKILSNLPPTLSVSAFLRYGCKVENLNRIMYDFCKKIRIDKIKNDKINTFCDSCLCVLENQLTNKKT